MTDIRIERDFAVSPERLFRAITERADLVAWWGPEGMAAVDSQFDFTATGPWFAVIRGENGQDYKMSGQITRVDPPRTVGFTWGWHDDTDARGPESHVTLTVVETGSGARLIVDHRDLDEGEMAQSHETGWTSSLASLATHLNDQTS